MLIEILLIMAIIVVIYFVFYKKDKKKIKINIDDIEIVERSNEMQKYIKSLKNVDLNRINYNKFQFFNKKNNKNITNDVLNGNIENEITITEIMNTNPAKNVIDSVLIDENEITCKDVEILKNPKYLKNFYYDMYGNKIESNLQDYLVDYHFNYDDKNCRSVNTIKGHSEFIIPNQYPTLKYQTNAYNIDWNRVINPLTYY
jgi:hypothetical protein